MARALARLYTSQAYGDAIPESVQVSLKQGPGNRMFVVDTDLFLALRRALYGHQHAESVRHVEQLWTESKENVWGGEMIPQGRIVLARDLSEYTWPTEEGGSGHVTDPADTAHNPSWPVGGIGSVAAERYTARLAAEEVEHLFLDTSLPVVVQEIIAKAAAADMLLYVGQGNALDPGLLRCRDYRDRLESAHGEGFHALARLGFDNLHLGPNVRTGLIEQIGRDAEAEDLLGEGYKDLFSDPVIRTAVAAIIGSLARMCALAYSRLNRH